MILPLAPAFDGSATIAQADDLTIAECPTFTHAAIIADVVNQAVAVTHADRTDDEAALLAAMSRLARAVRALEAL